MKCANCSTEKISEKVSEFSQNKYGKVLCFECQKTINEIKQNTGPVVERTIHSPDKPVVSSKVWEDKDRRIVRQNVLRHATNLLKMHSEMGILKDKTYNEIEIELLRIAEKLEIWVYR